MSGGRRTRTSFSRRRHRLEAVNEGRNEPESVQIALIDPKILTFAGVEGSPYLWRPVATTLADAMAILRDAVAEMDARYQLLARGGFVNLGERFKAGKTDLPFLLLIFDEFADLILAGRENKKEFESLVARIAGKGRAAGIHLVLATQRPDRLVVTGLIKGEPAAEGVPQGGQRGERPNRSRRARCREPVRKG
jgi:S-DNA-T family DNA segregation ATPase FtsK/SpoIIIE